MQELLFLLLSLTMILVSAEIFTNGVESLGRKLSLSQAVVGSLLAAIGTALPETILPFVAILVHGGDSAKQIGVGAILGAPFMLSTIAFFLVGITVTASWLMKKRRFEIIVESESMKRDLVFFMAMYGAAIILPLFIPKANIFIAVLLVAGYVFYAYLTFKGESSDIMHAEDLYFKKIAGRLTGKMKSEDKTASIPLISFQIITALSIMISGAHIFVGNIEKLSLSWGMNPLLFALLVAPIATELPEKFNSVTWTIKGRDSLAMGNITGAMVFQSTFPVSLGLIFTDWQISGLALFSAALALISTAVALADITFRKKLSPLTILSGGAFYMLYAAVIIMGK
jgi:cation:H+ antiporter